MSQESSPFIRGLTPKVPNAPMKRSAPLLPADPVKTALGPNKNRFNPFLSAMNSDSAEFREMYGVNRPLEKPMFLGYRDDKPMYGGSRLFLLY